jgi:hypothetical protein
MHTFDLGVQGMVSERFFLAGLLFQGLVVWAFFFS